MEHALCRIVMEEERLCYNLHSGIEPFEVMIMTMLYVYMIKSASI
jgi:hypothetical protein